MLAADGWSRGRRCAWFSSLCSFIASIAGVVIVIDVHGMVGFASDLDICLGASASLPVSAHQDRRSVPGLVEQREYGRAYR